jgi:formylglycine-generating enzyme required for sulfatase activity
VVVLALAPACRAAEPPGREGLGGLQRIAVQPGPSAWVELSGGRFTMGDAEGEADEVVRAVTLPGFALMRHEVTNQQFAAFVAATGHLTNAEKNGFGWVWPGRWQRASGADWRHPFGPASSQGGRGQHPVVQVSANDAAAFCAHHGWRLPSDEEWEFAARGSDRRRHPWGDGPPEGPDGVRLANFGTLACCAAEASDGFTRTAPVGSFPAGASPFGLLDMAGNVWEWTASPYPPRPDWVTLRGGGWGNDPYCLRTSYRHGNPPDIGLDMVGFRCAADLD